MRVLAILFLVALPVVAAAQRGNLLPIDRFNQPGTYALTHVSVIDGTGAPIKRDQTIVIEGGRIAFVGDAAGAGPIPSSAEVLDLTGHTVFPGLVMMHEHLHNEPSVSAQLWLARGVTTVRTAGAFEPASDLNMRQWIREGRTPGPELFLSGPFLSEHAEHLVRIIPLTKLRDADHARRMVRFSAEEGFDAVKVYRGITPPMLRVVVAEARKHRIPVIGHLEAVTCAEAARIGIDSIEHGITGCVDQLTGPDVPRLRDPQAPAVRALFATLLKHNVAISETPVDLRPLTQAELAVLHTGSRDDYEKRLATNELGVGTSTVTDDRQGAPSLTMAFVRAGGTVVLGSDTGGMPRIPGFSNLRSLKLLYTNYGFDPIEAIRIATYDGARFLRIDKRTGSVAARKEADLVVVRGDPSKRMRDVDNIALVFSNGVRYDPAKLLEANRGLYKFAAHEHALKRGRKVFWSRGNGWVIAGIVRMLDNIQADFPDRQRYVTLFKKMAATIAALQGEDGYWRASLLDPASLPNPESRGTGFFTCALAWGINHGLLERTVYEPHVRHGWAAMEKAVRPDGMLGWVQPIGAEPGSSREDTTEIYGVGALLLAGAEVHRLDRAR